MLSTLAIAGYRSLRDVRIALGPLNVVSGANGSGKSSLYRALRLLADSAQGRLVTSLAAEGGLASTLWAGPQTVTGAMRRGEQPVEGQVRRGPVSLKLGFGAEDYGYAVDLGLPGKAPTMFFREPRDQDRGGLDGRAPHPYQCFRDARRTARPCPVRRGPLAAGRERNGAARQSDDPLRRPARRTGLAPPALSGCRLGASTTI